MEFRNVSKLNTFVTPKVTSASSPVNISNWSSNTHVNMIPTCSISTPSSVLPTTYTTVHLNYNPTSAPAHQSFQPVSTVCINNNNSNSTAWKIQSTSNLLTSLPISGGAVSPGNTPSSTHNIGDISPGNTSSPTHRSGDLYSGGTPSPSHTNGVLCPVNTSFPTHRSGDLSPDNTTSPTNRSGYHSSDITPTKISGDLSPDNTPWKIESTSNLLTSLPISGGDVSPGNTPSSTHSIGDISPRKTSSPTDRSGDLYRGGTPSPSHRRGDLSRDTTPSKTHRSGELSPVSVAVCPGANATQINSSGSDDCFIGNTKNAENLTDIRTNLFCGTTPYPDSCDPFPQNSPTHPQSSDHPTLIDDNRADVFLVNTATPQDGRSKLIPGNNISAYLAHQVTSITPVFPSSSADFFPDTTPTYSSPTARLFPNYTPPVLPTNANLSPIKSFFAMARTNTCSSTPKPPRLIPGNTPALTFSFANLKPSNTPVFANTSSSTPSPTRLIPGNTPALTFGSDNLQPSNTPVFAIKSKPVKIVDTLDKRITDDGSRRAKEGHKVQARSYQAGAFVCEDCGKSFPKAHRLTEHSMTHNPKPCPYCDKLFKSYAGLRKHDSSVHENSKFLCLTCQKQFRSIESLLRHQKLNVCSQELTGKPINCPKCDLKFKNKKVMKVHMKNKHMEID